MIRNAKGPRTQAADILHAMKYRSPGEDFREAMNRVAFRLADDGDHYHEFREILLAQRFLPGGRVQGAIGASRKVTPYNCLSGDTEFLTADGFLKLRDAVGHDVKVLSPVSGSFEPAKVLAYGKQNLFRITVSNSSNGDRRAESFTIDATEHHRWVLLDGRVTQNLFVGNILKCGSSTLDGCVDGWVHGFVYGDGTKLRDATNGAPKSNPEFAADYPFKKFAVRLCGRKAAHLPKFFESSLRARATYPQSNEGDPWVVCFTERELKDIPGTNEPAEYIRGFVEGLLAADGCFSTRGNDAFQFHGGEAIVRWMRDHLIYADYAPSGRAHIATSSPTEYGERSEPLWKQAFRPSKEHKGFRVLKIEPLGENDTFCVEEPIHKQFTLRNGLATGNCFVMPTISDSFTDGEHSIMNVAKDAAATMRAGGGVGYDFSTLRPRGDLIMKLASHSSGPVNFMSIFDAICKCVASSGHRRGAQMGVLRCDHPDAEEFIMAKQNATNLTAFNVSLAITDEFMEALAAKRTFALRFGGKTYREVDAEEFWEKVMRSTYDWAEPGVLFIDRINEMNNLWYCEALAAVNPCAEQPLPPYGACLLGSFNLTAYLTQTGKRLESRSVEGMPSLREGGFVPTYTFDFTHLRADVPIVVQAMDNVVDRALYPLTAQEHEAKAKRRMGLGVTGLANAAEACGFPYGSPAFLKFEENVLDLIKVETYRASAEIATKKGPFPLFDAEKYLAGKFVATLPDDVRALIAKNGIRNSHLTSIAPTGTISMCADNVSSSIEPVFAYSTTRPINTPEGPVMTTIEDFGARFLGIRGKLAADVTAAEHVAVLVAAQKHVDSAVSKTCNVDGSMSYAEFKNIYMAAYDGGAKGCTTFRQDGKRAALLTPTKPESLVLDGATCEVDLATGRRNCE